jgi:hypothetical protein
MGHGKYTNVHHFYLAHTRSPFQVRGKKYKNVCIQIEKEESKLSLFANGIIQKTQRIRQKINYNK